MITTTNSGSVVQDGVNGFLAPARDHGAVAARMERLRQDPALRRAMIIAARRSAERFTWERYGDRVVSALSSIANRWQ